MNVLTDFKYNKVLLIFIVIGLMVSLVLSYDRHRIEQANKDVDMIYEYNEILELAGHSGKPVEEVMRLFKESGINALAIHEVTPEFLEKRGIATFSSGAEILSQNRAGLLQNGVFKSLIDSSEIKPDEVYINVADVSDRNDIREDCEQRFGKERVRMIEAQGIIAVKTALDLIYEQQLGFLTSELRQIGENGFTAIVRPVNYHAVTSENIKHVFRRIDKANVKVSAMVFEGMEALGLPDKMEETAARLKERSITLGMIEHPLQLQFDKQKGTVDMAPMVDYQVARLYVIEDKEQRLRLDVPKTIRRWALTDEERNIRMNYLRSFWEVTPGKDLLDTNLEYVSLVHQSVLKRGFNIADAGIFEAYRPNPLVYIPIVFGAVAAGVLYLSMLTQLLTFKRQILLTVLAAGALSVPFVFGYPLVIRQAVAFLSAVIFPVLAMSWQLGNWEKIPAWKDYSLIRLIFDSSWQLAATVLLSLIGGAYVSGMLCDIRFFLELDIYRGVKLTFLMPLVLITLVYLKRYTVLGDDMHNQKGLLGQIKELCNYPIYLKTLALMGVGLVIAYIFIGRTGHTSGVPVPGIELKMRFFLEEVMYARPREKEFLVGHPAFYLAAFAAWRNLPHLLYYCLVIGATIGQGCLVETFAHMRTPVMMSTIRAIDGLLMGEVIGIIVVIGVAVIYPLGMRAYEEVRRNAGET